MEPPQEIVEYPRVEARVSAEGAPPLPRPERPGGNGSSNQLPAALRPPEAPVGENPCATDPSVPPDEPRRSSVAALDPKIVLAAAAMVAVALGLAIYFGLRAARPSPTSKEDQAVLVTRLVHVFSDPVGADVDLDGKRVGTTPVDVPLAGSALLTLHRSGFVSEERRVSDRDPGWARQGNRRLLVLWVPMRRAPDAGPAASAEGEEGPESKAVDHVPRGRAHHGAKGTSRRHKKQSAPPSPWTPFKPGPPTARE